MRSTNGLLRSRVARAAGPPQRRPTARHTTVTSGNSGICLIMLRRGPTLPVSARVAQLDRASASGAEGRGFESRLARSPTRPFTAGESPQERDACWSNSGGIVDEDGRPVPAMHGPVEHLVGAGERVVDRLRVGHLIDPAGNERGSRNAEIAARTSFGRSGWYSPVKRRARLLPAPDWSRRASTSRFALIDILRGLGAAVPVPFQAIRVRRERQPPPLPAWPAGEECYHRR